MNAKTLFFAAGFSAAGIAAAFTAAPVVAAGTVQGTDITNNVTVSYQVGGVSQTAVAAADTFKVDRKINLSVTEATGAATSVSPGQSGAVTTFRVTNDSNDTIDFKLDATQQVGGAAKFTGTDNFDVTGLQTYRETNGTAGLQLGAGGDTLTPFLDEIAPDATVTVYVVAAVPLGRTTGDVSTVALTAIAHVGGTAGQVGVLFTETAGANTAGVDTVLADLNTANGNTARDGRAIDRSDYIVSAASLSANKNSVIISDPVNGTNNPKMIPGAVVQYCIAVSNGTGSATATNITLSDTLPVQTLFDASYPVRVDGSATGGVCDASTGTTIAGGHSNGMVSGTLSDIGAGITRTLLFRVTVK